MPFEGYPYIDCVLCAKKEDCEKVRDARKTGKTVFGVCKDYKYQGVFKTVKA